MQNNSNIFKTILHKLIAWKKMSYVQERNRNIPFPGPFGGQRLFLVVNFPDCRCRLYESQSLFSQDLDRFVHSCIILHIVHGHGHLNESPAKGNEKKCAAPKHVETSNEVHYNDNSLRRSNLSSHVIFFCLTSCCDITLTHVLVPLQASRGVNAAIFLCLDPGLAASAAMNGNWT